MSPVAPGLEPFPCALTLCLHEHNLALDVGYVYGFATHVVGYRCKPHDCWAVALSLSGVLVRQINARRSFNQSSTRRAPSVCLASGWCVRISSTQNQLGSTWVPLRKFRSGHCRRDSSPVGRHPAISRGFRKTPLRTKFVRSQRASNRAGRGSVHPAVLRPSQVSNRAWSDFKPRQVRQIPVMSGIPTKPAPSRFYEGFVNSATLPIQPLWLLLEERNVED